MGPNTDLAWFPLVNFVVVWLESFLSALMIPSTRTQPLEKLGDALVDNTGTVSGERSDLSNPVSFVRGSLPGFCVG